MSDDYRKSKKFFNKQVTASILYKETYVASSLIDNLIVAMLSIEILAGMGFITSFMSIMSCLDTVHFNSAQLFLSKEIGKEDKKNLTEFINRLIILIIGSILIRIGILFYIRDIFEILGFNKLVSEGVYEQFVVYTIVCTLGLSISDGANAYFRYLNKIGHTTSKVKSAVYDIVPNIVFSLLLAPKYQIIGVGLGTLIGKICRASYALYILYTRRHNEDYVEHKYLFRSYNWSNAINRFPTVISNGSTAIADYFSSAAIALFVMNIGLGYAALINLLGLLRKFIKPIPASISEGFTTLYGYHKGKGDFTVIPSMYFISRNYILIISVIQVIIYTLFIFVFIPPYIAKNNYTITIGASLIVLSIYVARAISDLIMHLYYDIAGVNKKSLWANISFTTFNVATVILINFNILGGSIIDVTTIEVGYVIVNAIPLIILNKKYFIDYMKDLGAWEKGVNRGLIYG